MMRIVRPLRGETCGIGLGAEQARAVVVVPQHETHVPAGLDCAAHRGRELDREAGVADGVYSVETRAVEVVLKQPVESVADEEGVRLGPTEGQINRLKTLKRTMNGRAGVDSLRARMTPLPGQSPHRHLKPTRSNTSLTAAFGGRGRARGGASALPGCAGPERHNRQSGKVHTKSADNPSTAAMRPPSLPSSHASETPRRQEQEE